MRHWFLGILGCLVLLFRPNGLGAEGSRIRIQAPPFSLLRMDGIPVSGDRRTGKFLLLLPSAPGQVLHLEARGPLGGVLKKDIIAATREQNLQIPSGIISDGAPNPTLLATLPALCPRLRPSITDGDIPRYIYDGDSDPLNRVPVTQISDPDAWRGNQSHTLDGMDGRNVLLLRKIRITYDYEDSNIIDYERMDPKTGKMETVYEGMGGFYANFHYAALPYDPRIAGLPRQTLLHLAEGKLQEIGREDLSPALRTHGFFPGPFLSKVEWNYPACEWGDTEYQAPEQQLEYQDIALWDWDYSVPESGHILLIVWENDEEDTLIREGKIPKTHLVGDVVGVFEMRREATREAITLKNARDDFEITVQTGNLQGTSPHVSSLKP